MDLQVLATEQYRYIRRLLAGDGELMHDLQLHILRHTFFPEASPVDKRRVAALHSWAIPAMKSSEIIARVHEGVFTHSGPRAAFQRSAIINSAWTTISLDA